MANQHIIKGLPDAEVCPECHGHLLDPIWGYDCLICDGVGWIVKREPAAPAAPKEIVDTAPAA